MYPFERFTEKAKKVLTLAQDEAEKSHHSYIGTEHLLLGLLREGEGLAAKVLANLGVEIDKVRDTIDSVLGRNERIIVQQIIPTSRVKKVIEIAFEEAKRMNNTCLLYTSGRAPSWTRTISREQSRSPRSTDS